MNSIESNALEPTRDELANLGLGVRLLRLAPVYGLVILMVVLIALFSRSAAQHLPDHAQPARHHLRQIDHRASVAGAMIPMAAGRIDLTVGYGIVLWHILAISLQTSGPDCPGRSRS
jgi:ribose transport system permease protein